jgi:hypothetical protein
MSAHSDGRQCTHSTLQNGDLGSAPLLEAIHGSSGHHPFLSSPVDTASVQSPTSDFPLVSRVESPINIFAKFIW